MSVSPLFRRAFNSASISSSLICIGIQSLNINMLVNFWLSLSLAKFCVTVITLDSDEQATLIGGLRSDWVGGVFAKAECFYVAIVISKSEHISPTNSSSNLDGSLREFILVR